MLDVWKKLDQWLAENAPEAFAALNQPASEAAVSAAEAQINLTFPPSLKAFFLEHDGEARDSAGLFIWWRLLPLCEVVDIWEEFLLIEQQSEVGILGSGAFDAKRSIPVMWFEGQIRYVEVTDDLFEGPLLELPRHGPPKFIALSLNHFFESQFEMIINGQLVVEPDFGFSIVPVGTSVSDA